jgi:hypothetical protein
VFCGSEELLQGVLVHGFLGGAVAGAFERARDVDVAVDRTGEDGGGSGRRGIGALTLVRGRCRCGGDGKVVRLLGEELRRHSRVV